MQDKELARDLGHNLVACFRQCRSRGLCRYLFLERSQVRLIVRVNRYYQEKHLEYFTAINKQFGSIMEFELIVEQVSNAVFNPITEQDFRSL